MIPITGTSWTLKCLSSEAIMLQATYNRTHTVVLIQGSMRLDKGIIEAARLPQQGLLTETR